MECPVPLRRKTHSLSGGFFKCLARSFLVEDRLAQLPALWRADKHCHRRVLRKDQERHLLGVQRAQDVLERGVTDGCHDRLYFVMSFMGGVRPVLRPGGNKMPSEYLSAASGSVA